MPAEKLPTAPPGLSAPGRALWKGILDEFDLSPGERAVLETACRALDRMREAERLIADEGMTVPGRFSRQPHPAVLIARDASAALRAALKQLKVELDDGEAAKVSRPGPRPQTKIRAQKRAIAERRAAQWGGGA